MLLSGNILILKKKGIESSVYASEGDIQDFIGGSSFLMGREYYYEINADDIKKDEYDLVQNEKIELTLDEGKCREYLNKKLRYIEFLVNELKLKPEYETFTLLRDKTTYELGSNIYVILHKDYYEILNELEFYSKYMSKHYTFEVMEKHLYNWN